MNVCIRMRIINNNKTKNQFNSCIFYCYFTGRTSTKKERILCEWLDHSNQQYEQCINEATNIYPSTRKLRCLFVYGVHSNNDDIATNCRLKIVNHFFFLHFLFVYHLILFSIVHRVWAERSKLHERKTTITANQKRKSAAATVKSIIPTTKCSEVFFFCWTFRVFFSSYFLFVFNFSHSEKLRNRQTSHGAFSHQRVCARAFSALSQ